MRVHIGPYKRFIGPYQIADMIFFWVPEYEENESYAGKIRDRFAEFLAHGFQGKNHAIPENTVMEAGVFCDLIETEKKQTHYTWFYNLLQWIDEKRNRKIKVRIDPWDTVDAAHSMALIALPLMKQFKDNHHGSPMIDPDDMPDHLQFRSHLEWGTSDQLAFDFYEQTERDHSNLLHDRFDWLIDEVIWALQETVDDDWEDQYKIGDREWDWEGMKKHSERIDNGLTLFGKYFRAFWD